MSEWAQIKAEQMFDYQRTICEVATCRNPAAEAHHALLPRKKGQRWRDSKYNMVLLCADCHKHNGNAQGPEARQWFAKALIAMHGRQNMIDWLDSAPPKTKLTPRWQEVRRLVDWPVPLWENSRTGI